jgi:hypothetical protein
MVIVLATSVSVTAACVYRKPLGISPKILWDKIIGKRFLLLGFGICCSFILFIIFLEYVQFGPFFLRFWNYVGVKFDDITMFKIESFNII